MRKISFYILFALTAIGLRPPVAVMAFSDYATELVSYSGDLGNYPCDDPYSALGKPTTMCKNMPSNNDGSELYRIKIVEAAAYLDPNGNKVIVGLTPIGEVVIKFDHRVVDYPSNLYGKDLIVFGNAFFTHSSSSYISDTADARNITLTGAINSESVIVAVSQDGQTWYEYSSGPFADELFPTQSYVWDVNQYIATGNGWTDEEMDFTKPVDPNLGLSDFANKTLDQAIELYDGSGGGTAYDLQDLAEYNSLVVDPNSGYRWIQYVRISNSYGEVDAVSDVAACGDPTHLYPIGDVNKDCRVDFNDFALMSLNWLECSYDCD